MRELSIPPKLGRSIIRRWLKGKSERDILAWVEQRGIQTSRSSVHRFIDHYSGFHDKDTNVHLVRRCRMRALQTLDALDDVEAGFARCVVDAETLENAMDNNRFSARLRALTRRELCLRRSLKLARIDGSSESIRRARAEVLSIVNENDRGFCMEIGDEMEADGEYIQKECGTNAEDPNAPIEAFPCGIFHPENYASPIPESAGAAEIPGSAKATEIPVRLDGQNCEKTRQIESNNAISEPGRNAPCRCGSGKKYKRCCLGESQSSLP